MVKPPLRTKSIGFKVSEEEYAQLETAAQADGRTLGEWVPGGGAGERPGDQTNRAEPRPRRSWPSWLR
jgi:hypothetical protein